MKLTPSMITRMSEWVAENGLGPSKHMDGVTGGAEINEFCSAFDIPYITFKRWTQNVNFVTEIKRANELWKKVAAKRVYNALLKKALGFTQQLTDSQYAAQVVTEETVGSDGKVKTRKRYTTDKGVKTKEVRKTVHYPPDTGAAIFLLTNLDPEHWKNRRDEKTDIDLSLNGEVPPTIVFGAPEAPEPEDNNNQNNQQQNETTPTT